MKKSVQPMLLNMQNYYNCITTTIKILIVFTCDVFIIGEMIISNDKYNMTELTVSYYSAQMKLTIRKLKKSDLGGYKCISKNSIGEAEGNIRVYGKI